MPVRYDQDTKAKAIRLVREHAGDYPLEYAAITAVARRLGMTPETLRKWIRQAAVDEGRAPGVTTEAAKEIRELKRKVPELERTIGILSAAAGFSRGSTTRCAADLRVHRRSPRPVRGRADLPCPDRARYPDRPADVLGAPVPAAVPAGPEGRGADGDPGRGIYELGPDGRRPPECLYGSLKMWDYLRRQGITVARCTVERLMRAHGWRGVTRARTVRTTIGDPAHHRAPDLGKRNFTAGRPGQLHVPDLTCVPLDGGGFGCTAFVIDAFAGLIAGWECSLPKETAFVERAIRQAAAWRAR